MSEFEHKHEIPFFGKEELANWKLGFTNVDISELKSLTPEERSDLQRRVNECLHDILSAEEFIDDGNLAIEKEWKELPENVENLFQEIAEAAAKKTDEEN